MDQLLIVEDDVELCELLAERFKRDGFSLDAVHDGVHGLERALSGQFKLVILDLMLPGLGGLDVLRKLRAQSGIPVLILTACGEDVERILGLEIGADDYLPKPFNPRELIARVRAILRRSSSVTSDGERLTAGDITLDTGEREAWIDDRQMNLTSVEFSLLQAFMRNAGHVVTRDDLTETVLGRKLGAFDRVIDVHVSNLRKKLGASSAGDRIKAVRGAGYQFVVRSERKKT